MLQLILLERNTLIKGWFLCFAVVLPVTFLPIISVEGDLWVNILDRFPKSLVYSAAFATVFCLAAVYYNYERLHIKINYFNKPAFKELDSTYIPSGKGSLVEDLGFYLFCNHNQYTYHLDLRIDLDDLEKRQLIVVPLSNGRENFHTHERLAEYRKLLGREFKVHIRNQQLEITLMPEEINAEDPNAMTKTFNRIEAKLNVIPTG